MTRTVDGTAVFHEAIKTINDLRADNERLRKALKFTVEVLQRQNLAGSVYAPVLQQARKALAQRSE